MDVSFIIAVEFSKQYRKKYGRVLYSIKTVRESRWWVHFEKASTFINRENVSGFLQYFFERDFIDDKILPHMLVSKMGRGIYKDYLDSERVSEGISSSNKIKETLFEIDSWCKKNNITKDKIKNFVKHRPNSMKIERGMLYEPIFLFSKEYTKNIITEEINLRKSLFRRKYQRVYDVIKEISGDDFVD